MVLLLLLLVVVVVVKLIKVVKVLVVLSVVVVVVTRPLKCHLICFKLDCGSVGQVACTNFDENVLTMDSNFSGVSS